MREVAPVDATRPMVAGPFSTAVTDRPGAVVAAILALHVLLWTLVPAMVHRGLPIDLVEGYGIAKEWVLATYKHPALPYWVLEATRALTGAIGWPAYLVSSLCVAATVAMVYRLGRDMTDGPGAAVGALLLTGVLYFNWVTPEFNHNVAQMPAWIAIVLALWRARTTGRMLWWVLLGVASAAGVYIKLSTGFLLIAAAIYILADARTRRQIATPAPWLSLAVFILLIAPFLRWMWETDFAIVSYAEERALRKSEGVGVFLLKQWLSVVVLGVMLAVAMMPLRREPAERPAPRDALAFLLWVHFAPHVLLIAVALANKAGLKGSWGTAMASLNGLGLVLIFARLGWHIRVGRVVAGAALMTLSVPALYGLSVTYQDAYTRRPQRVNWPQQEIARRLEGIWTRETGRPLGIVAGDIWTAGQVAVHSASRPSVLIQGEFEKSPWVTRERIAREGALVVWLWGFDNAPSSLAPLIGNRPQRREVFWTDLGKTRPDKADHRIEIYYAVVPPR